MKRSNLLIILLSLLILIIVIMNMKDQSKNAGFTLDFFVGGNLDRTVAIKIAGAHITYRETTDGDAKEVKKIKRLLSPTESDDIRKTIMDANLLSLKSQDFTREPLIPDQEYYRIFLSIDRKKNTIACGLESTSECQRQIDKLRLMLNSILGVNI